MIKKATTRESLAVVVNLFYKDHEGEEGSHSHSGSHSHHGEENHRSDHAS